MISLIDGNVSSQEAALVEQFAQTLEVSAPEMKDLRHVVNRDILQLRLDLVRRFWLREGQRGSLGRSYWEHCKENGFPLPGERGGAAKPMFSHDCAHILSGYERTLREKCRSPVSVQDFSGAIRGYSSSLSSYGSTSGFV